jgi:hypothetical protein
MPPPRGRAPAAPRAESGRRAPSGPTGTMMTDTTLPDPPLGTLFTNLLAKLFGLLAVFGILVTILVAVGAAAV